ncbi:MAG: DUF3800 domain-containing protein [Chloroflexi bacterium]|nr:DUF3800 domain-containing protein [Chloroflexota bacterium]
MTTKYRIYIDETGNSSIKSARSANERFLSLTGIIISLPHVQATMHPQMEELKVRHFGSHPDDPVILHRKDILKKKRRFDTLRNLSAEDAFNQDLLAHLRDWEYSVITVCIDKKAHLETHETSQMDPYHYCLAVLLERFYHWLNRKGVRGDVMAEARGGKEDMRLKEEFRRLWENGTQYIEQGMFQSLLTSRELKVRSKSANIAGLQLADLIAHPSRSEILQEQGLLGRELSAFALQIVEILMDKYDRNGKEFI